MMDVKIYVRICKITISNDLVIYVTKATWAICGLRISVLSFFFFLTQATHDMLYS